MGFDVLEVRAQKIKRMSSAERDTLKAAAAEAGLGLTYSIGLQEDNGSVSEDSSVREKGVTFLQDLCKAMKQMDGKVMAGINYSSWPRKLMPGEDKKVLTDRAVEGVRERSRLQKTVESFFAWKVGNRFEHFIMNTAAEGIEFAKRVESPNCKILLDTFHMNIEEDSFRGALLESKEWLGHFHLGEKLMPSRRGSNALAGDPWGAQ